MAAIRDSAAPAPHSKPLVVVGVIAVALALRLLHLSAALQSPLTYQPGPDEDYYQRFGAAVAAGHGADTPEFTFMDPGYGYLLGALFKLTGVNPFAAYLLQVLLDVGTAYGILTLGRKLDRPRAGLLGALIYGATSTAILFCATLLKETCVAAFVTWWAVAAVSILRSERRLAWAAFGALCGLGVALRSTLLLFGIAALLLPVVARWMQGGPDASPPREWLLRGVMVAAGMLAAVLPWSIRNAHAFGSWSPLPHNGGIVLHQAYNADNPGSAIWIPPFVNYLHPSEIWRGYAAEAERRVGHALPPRAVDDFWRDRAFDFMRAHPMEVLGDAARKGLAFLAASEIPNNRSAAEERLFSPVLRFLPPPMPFLLALGLAGVVWLALRDRRWPLVAGPIAIAWVTVCVFWAEDRFRFHAAPMLALSSGIFIDGLVRGVRDHPRARVVLVAGLAGLIGIASVILGRQLPAPAVRWDHIVWGFIKMGRFDDASSVAERVSREQPDNAPVEEALGYLAARARAYPAAIEHYRRAIALRPRSYLAHYNLAKAYFAQGERSNAVREAALAASLAPSADTEALLRQLRDAP